MKPLKANVTVNCDAANITIPIPTLRYLNRFMRSSCAIDLLMSGVFPNAKEISESYAAVNAVERKTGISSGLMKRLNPHILVVGDGCTPRTGAALAFNTPYDIISIDPEMRKTEYPDIQRLEVFQTKLGDFEYEFTRPIIMVAVHSHVPTTELISFHAKVDDKLMVVVENPCCHPQTFLDAFGPPNHEYVDWGIHSPKRDMRIWKFKEKNTKPLMGNMIGEVV